MASKPLPSPEVLRQLLRYEPETGKLFWLPRPARMFTPEKRTPEHSAANWNARYAQKEALTSLNKKGYRHGNIFASLYLAHRVIWTILHGEEPPDQIDHINGNPSDNRIGNLRLATRAENMCNRRVSSHSRTGVKGVDWRAKEGRWRARISCNGRLFELGMFDTLDAASSAYRDAAKKLHGEFARTK